MPWLDLLFLKNPLVLLLDRLGVKFLAFPVATFAQERMKERLMEMEAQGIEKGMEKPDLLSMFLKAQNDRPEFMTDHRVLTMAISMAFAGSETTAISLAAVFYYLLRNPRCYEKLMQELDEAVEEGRVADTPTGTVTWTESQQLPYLDACIKEAFRMHPAAGLPLERITPPQGIEIDGHFIPGGTVVGCNAWVIHKREDVFGSHVDSYVPERWLDVGKDQLREMNGTLFQFGAGSRTCIGKNISLLEMYKLIPAFLRRFEVCCKLPRCGLWHGFDKADQYMQIRFDDPSKDWKLHNGKFHSRWTPHWVGADRFLSLVRQRARFLLSLQAKEDAVNWHVILPTCLPLDISNFVRTQTGTSESQTKDSKDFRIDLWRIFAEVR